MPISFVQFKNGAVETAATDTFQLVLDTPITAGDIIVLAMQHSDQAATQTISSVTASGSYSDCGKTVKDGLGGDCIDRMGAFFSPSGGTTTITIVFGNPLNGTTEFANFTAWVIRGYTAAAWDQSNTGGSQTNTTTLVTGSTGGLAGAEAAVAFFDCGDHATVAGSGWSATGNNGIVGTATGGLAESQVTPDGTPIVGSGTQASSVFGGIVAAIKETGGGPGSFSINGVTRDNIGNLIGSCDVFLLKYNSGTHTFTQVDHTTSNASTGAYTFSAIADNDPDYCVVAWKDGTPHVFDVSDRNVRPA